MDRNTGLVVLHRTWLVCGKDAGVRRIGEMRSDLALRIVIAAKQNDRDARLVKSSKLIHKEEAGVVILPFPIINVSGQDHEIDVFGDRKTHKIAKRVSGGSADRFDRSSFVLVETAEWAVKVKIGGVNKLEHPATSAGVKVGEDDNGGCDSES